MMVGHNIRCYTPQPRWKNLEPVSKKENEQGPGGSRESASSGAHDAVFQLVRGYVPSGQVLDVPCGSGAFTRRLLQSGYTTCAADFNTHDAIPEEASFHQADMNEPLPFEDNSFDGVVSIEGIEHIKRPFDFVQECSRILRPGGLLIITTPNVSSLRSRWRWFLTGFHNKSKYPLDELNPAPRHHINMISFPQMRYMLHTSGFHIEQIATNRVKPISWAYAPLVPIVSLWSRLAFRPGVRNQAHQNITDEVRTQMTSLPVLFGETMIIVARAAPE